MVDEERKEPFFESDEIVTPSHPWMVGLFDVLGFSNLITESEKSVEKIYEIYQTLIQRVIEKEGLRCLGLVRVSPDDKSRYPTAFYCETRYTYFSDTILFWLPFTPPFVAPFLQRCSDLLCEALLMGVPLRGAISVGYGYMHKKTGIYLGEMIVDAHKLEGSQNWLGAGLTPHATHPLFLSEASPNQIIEFAVPVKSGNEKTASPIALDWPRRWRDTEKSSLQEQLIKLRDRNQKEYWHYYDNAVAFADWSEKHHDWHKKQDSENGFKHLRMVAETEIGKPV